MDKVIKRTFMFVGVAIVVLYMTSIFLPMLISTNTIPVTLILIIATTTIACGFISMYYVVKLVFIEKNLKDIHAKKDDYTDHIC